MRKMSKTWGVLGILLMFGGCIKGGKTDGDIMDGGHGIGIDSATVNRLDVAFALDSIMADTIRNDGAAPKDEPHSVERISERVKTFYRLMDDGRCCSTNYLALRALAEKVTGMEGADLKEKVGLEENHWTMGEDEDAANKDWSYQILEVEGITMHRAEVLVEVKKYYETRLRLHLVLERGDWYVDNFDVVTQTAYDAVVGVYEEHEVYYNEKEMMISFLR